MSDGTVPSTVPTELRATRRQIIRPEKDMMSATWRLLPSNDPLNVEKSLQAGRRCEAETKVRTNLGSLSLPQRSMHLLHVATKRCRLV